MKEYYIEKVVLVNNHHIILGDKFHGFKVTNMLYCSTSKELNVYLGCGKCYKIFSSQIVRILYSLPKN